MTKTLAKSREQKQQNATRFIKTALLLSTLFLSGSGQSFAAPAFQIESNSDEQKLKLDKEAKAKAALSKFRSDRAVKPSFLFNSSIVSNTEVSIYAGKVKSAIQKEFRESDSFRGRTCELQLKLSSDGLLEGVTPKNSPANDVALCNAAIKAVELARMPVPPSLEVYNTFNKAGSTIVFKP